MTDITYVPTDEGFLYLAAILDVHTRAVLGWSMATHLRTELCLDALDAVASCRGRRHFPGTVLHSDHGCQYTANLFKKRCKDMGITQSMGTVGDSYDKAMASYCTPYPCSGVKSLSKRTSLLLTIAGVSQYGWVKE